MLIIALISTGIWIALGFYITLVATHKITNLPYKQILFPTSILFMVPLIATFLMLYVFRTVINTILMGIIEGMTSYLVTYASANPWVHIALITIFIAALQGIVILIIQFIFFLAQIMVAKYWYPQKPFSLMSARLAWANLILFIAAYSVQIVTLVGYLVLAKG
jgi:hypothetical protein